MRTNEDRDYDAAQPGYGAADEESHEDTPPQEQQQPEHEQAGAPEADERDSAPRERRR
jgi:hypothetical protein